MKNLVVAFFGIFVATLALPMRGQECGDSVNTTQQLVKQAFDESVLLRAAAVSGVAIMPDLQRIYQPGYAFHTLQGSAEIALAKLGSSEAWKSLQQPLAAGPFFADMAIKKIAVVGNEQAVRVLMEYALAMGDSPAGRLPLGDTNIDTVYDALTGVISIVPDPPETHAYTSRLTLWRDWWKANKDRQLIPELATDPDPTINCEIRLAEFGFTDGIEEIVHRKGRASEPLLRSFLRLGPKDAPAAPAGTVRGISQIYLAKMGDKQSLEAIASDLTSGDYRYAIPNLTFIGTRGAVDVLVSSLDLHQFMRDVPSTAEPKLGEGRQLQKMVLAALATLVRNPPLSANADPTPTNVSTWQNWWSKHRTDVDVLR